MASAASPRLRADGDGQLGPRTRPDQDRGDGDADAVGAQSRLDVVEVTQGTPMPVAVDVQPAGRGLRELPRRS